MSLALLDDEWDGENILVQNICVESAEMLRLAPQFGLVLLDELNDAEEMLNAYDKIATGVSDTDKLAQVLAFVEENKSIIEQVNRLVS